jgi:hypothetical protein
VRGRLRIESSTLAWFALGVLLVLTAAVVLRETRDTTLWFDEWGWALDRRHSSLLESHNGHFSLIPLLIYRALFATAGMTDYLPYRVLVVIGHLSVAALLFIYARRRIGPLAALLPTAVLLTLGPAWQNFLWPFQIAWLISLSAGLVALLALDRGDRRGDAVACAGLAVALASSGIGVAIAAGLVVDVVGRRRPLWIVAAPLAMYALWWLGYQETEFFAHNVVVAPQFAADAASGAVATVVGLTEAHFDANGVLADAGATLFWGRPLLLVAVLLLIWRLAALRPVPVRVLALLASAAAFWLLGGLQRAQFGSPDSSRYLYVGALFVLLLAVELVRGVRAGRELAALAVVLTGVVVVANLGDLRAGGRYLRSQASLARADLGALELARGDVQPGYDAVAFPGIPFVELHADRYFAAARALGSPAYSPSQLAGASEQGRLAADVEIATIQGIAPKPSAARAGTTPPQVDAVTGGRVRTGGGCVRFTPDATTLAGTVPELQVTVPDSGLLMTAEGGPAGFSLRRFAATFPVEPTARLAPGGSSELRPGEDRASQPWHVRLKPEAGASACGLRP